MNGPSALAARLAARTSPAIVPGLERTRALLELLEHPERGLKVVHVAGTNGKGSVCRMIESVLSARGLRVGLYTSPHLVHFNERFRISGKSATDRALETAARPLWKALKTQSTKPEGPATYFEALTVLAFLYFKRRKVDVLVLETGLGGRLDSTNVVERPLLTVITNIALEHTQILGRTEIAIAREKAGILKKGSPLVTTAQGPARSVILRRFKEVQAGAKTVCVALRPKKDWQILSVRVEPEAQRQNIELIHLGLRHRVELPLLGAHQHENLACALAACKVLSAKLGLKEAHMGRGLAAATWPGRLQVLSLAPLTFVDGAHNPAGAKVLTDFVRDLRGHRDFPRVALVAGVLRDKDWRGMFQHWKPWVGRFFLATPPDSRALTAIEAARWLRQGASEVRTAKSLALALVQARRWAGPKGLVLAAGSLYSVGALLKNHRAR